MRLLNLGCGNRYHKSWTNIDFYSTGEDVIAHNLTKGIPFNNDTFDVVYHSHVLEHFSKETAAYFLKECFRVLKMNGIIRIAVPDLESIVRTYLEQMELALKSNEKAMANYDWILLEMYDQTVRNQRGGNMMAYLDQDTLVNESFIYDRLGYEAKSLRESLLKIKHQPKQVLSFKSKIKALFSLDTYRQKLLELILGEDFYYYEVGKFRMGGEVHQWMYDKYSLSKLLLQTGFSDPELRTAFISQIPEWNTYELESKDGVIFKPDSLFMEAVKLKLK